MNALVLHDGVGVGCECCHWEVEQVLLRFYVLTRLLMDGAHVVETLWSGWEG